MTTLVRLDFEIRSEVDLKKVGAWIYSRHPSTEVLCLAYDKELWVPDPFSTGGLECPIVISPDTLFEAHNAFFEQSIWTNICVARFGWPVIPIEQWRCSAAKAAYHSLPRSLDGVAKALELDEMKDAAGHKIMLKLSKPRKPTKNNKAKWRGTPEEYERLYSYCLQDVATEWSVSSALSKLPLMEQVIWEMDQRINQRGVPIDRELVVKAIAMLKEIEQENNREIFVLTEGAAKTTGQTKVIREFVNSLGDPIASLGKQEIAEYIANTPDIHPLSKKILELRLASAKSSTKKYQAMLDRMDVDDRIRESILYHGASTGRWTGLGIQTQNLPRGTIKEIEDAEDAICNIKYGDKEIIRDFMGDPMEILSSCVRPAICAPAGHELFCADFSAIEARVLLWLVGDRQALDMFRRGEDLYIDLASLIFGKAKSLVTKTERELGKRGVLGCGYQMWWPKFQATCKGTGLDIDDDLAKKAVMSYRKKYSLVPKFWADLERVVIQCIARKTTKHFNRLIISCDKKFLRIQLPSGRKLHYYKPHLSYDAEREKSRISYWSVNGTTRKWEKTYTYGGKLTENIVQAIARDILAEAMLRLERKNYPIILTVHDEVVSEVEKRKRSLREFFDIMKERPTWGTDIPLDVSGWRADRYGKWADTPVDQW